MRLYGKQYRGRYTDFHCAERFSSVSSPLMSGTAITTFSEFHLHWCQQGLVEAVGVSSDAFVIAMIVFLILMNFFVIFQ
ncbi:hypothetical protein E2C01_071400 [Portunus trituberculatus]|uniref:Uncharacterized protein n=1 Tax=Portunus trituberculatus TaxID=210409 RepID=A0A5B7I3V5_PORTR|nr:hypothetical protein [Portunus trituberculatus]